MVHAARCGQVAQQGTDREHSRGGRGDSWSHGVTSEIGEYSRTGKTMPRERPHRIDTLGTTTFRWPETRTATEGLIVSSPATNTTPAWRLGLLACGHDPRHAPWSPPCCG